ncbi:TPA: hypothetical protein ACXXXU_002517, partial [Enterococcus faecium]
VLLLVISAYVQLYLCLFRYLLCGSCCGMKRSTVNLSGAEFMKIISIMSPTTDPGNHNKD